MLIEKVLESAIPYLENRTIRDGVLGLSLIGIELDNEDIGLSYMLRDRLPPGCSSFGFAQEIIGANALEVAKLAVEGKDDAQRGVGVAVLTAGSNQLDIPDEDLSHPHFGLNIDSKDTIGMIGFIPPVAKRFSEVAREVIVFDKGISHSGGRDLSMIHPMDQQKELLPKCDVVIISGTTMINGTIDQLLDWCDNAREIVMVGSSTPMYPEAFRGTKVTILAGSLWNKAYKETLFKRLSLSCGISHISDAMIKKAIGVPK